MSHFRGWTIAALLPCLGLCAPARAQDVKVQTPQVSRGQPGVAGAGLGQGSSLGGQPALTLTPSQLQGGGVLPLPLVQAPLTPVAPAAVQNAPPAIQSPVLAPAVIQVQSQPAQPVAPAAQSVKPSAVRAAVAAAQVSPVSQAKDREQASALHGLLQHAPKAAESAGARDLGQAKTASEDNFLKATGLGGLSPFRSQAEPAPSLEPHTLQGRREAEQRPPARGLGAFFGRLLRPALRRAPAADEAAEGIVLPAPPAPDVRSADPNYRELVLDNGMQVQLSRDPGLFSATIAVGFSVGGRDEPAGESGYTHFLELLMFQGTRRVRNWFRLVGAMGGFSNAWTYPDHTLYVHTLPMNLLELGISLEAERMANLDITDAKVEREKRVILEEKAGRENAAFEGAWKRLTRLIFSNPRNQSDVIGSEADIRGATAAKLQGYFDAYYTPDRAKVVISGNIDLEETEAWVREYLGGVPARRSAAAKPDLGEPARPAGRRAEVLDSYTHQPALLFGWQAPSRGTADYYALSLAADLLQERLSRKLVYGLKRALSVSLNVPYLDRDPVALTGAIDFGPDMTEEQALAALEDEISSLRRGGFSEEELRGVAGRKVQWLRNQMGDSYSGTMLTLQAAVRGMSPAGLNRDLERFAAVSFADLRRAAALLSPASRSTVLVRPDPSPGKKAKPFSHRHESDVDETPTADELDLLKTLSGMQWFDVNFQIPESFRLSNGLKVILMPDGRRSTVYAKLAFRLGRAGLDADLREKIPMVASLLRLRTARLSETQMDDTLNSFSGRIVSDQKWDHALFDGNAPTEEAGTLLSLLSEMVSRPHAWTETELAGWKALWKEGLRATAGDPNTASHQRAIQDLLGDHPSARASLTEAAVDSLGPQEVSRLVREHFSPDNAVLVVAGDVNPEGLKSVLESLFEEWKPSGIPATPGAPAAVRAQSGISLIERPGSEQVFLRLSSVGPGDGSPASSDHFPLLVASEVMGGGWGSRLYRVARQAMGVAYNAFSSVVRDPAVAMWTFGLSSQPEKVQPALLALLDQSRSMRETQPSEVELASAKNSLIGSFLLSLDYIGSIADHLLGLELFDRPLSELGRYMSKVSDVTGAEVQRVSAKLLAPGRLNVTVVGDPGTLEKLKPGAEVEASKEPAVQRPTEQSAEKRSLLSRLFGR